MMADNARAAQAIRGETGRRSAIRRRPRARLQWWFQQSKYEAGDTGRYPIVRVWDKTW